MRNYLNSSLGKREIDDRNNPTERAQVEQYYNRKTKNLVDKYGPGPRIHYHLGQFDSGPPRNLTAHEIKDVIRAAQEDLLDLAASEWSAINTLRGRVIDFGCGLGGGSIFWAQNFGSNVTAVTSALEHIPLIRRFAEQAGVADRIDVLGGDACEVPAQGTFQAALAIESSCYFPLNSWFSHLSSIIALGGKIFIEDVFPSRPGGTALWDSYFHAHSAPIDAYQRAAEANGFRITSQCDITAGTAEFWLWSAAWIRAKLCEGLVDRRQVDRLRVSLETHNRLYHEWIAGGLEVGLLAFERV
ncbi:SAM-dependent methyltransferase [Streptomyces sp. NPDC059688]|uniref:SAM-dependent methyltransferase n=1 Tax=Streptomyces sp. NPDC059688 TaxID=3346906 RepID=UPI00368371CD